MARRRTHRIRWVVLLLAACGGSDGNTADASVDAARTNTDRDGAVSPSDASPGRDGASDAALPACPPGERPVTLATSAWGDDAGPVEIVGCRFGTPRDVAPMIWDDFEGGVAGEQLRHHSSWTAYRTDGAYYDADDAYSGALSASNAIWAGSGTEFHTNHQEFEPSNEVYLSYRFRLQVSGDRYGVLKLSRITSHYDGELSSVDYYNGPGSFAWTYQPASSWSYALIDYGGGTTQMTTGRVIEEWHRLETYIRLSSPGESDGAIWTAQDGQRTWEDDAIMTRGPGMEVQYHSVLLGLMLANPRDDGRFVLSIDDVFVASSQARVELGDAPVFEDCTNREVQPHDGWSETGVRITPHLGRLDPDAPIYLFVVDSSGTASEGRRLN